MKTLRALRLVWAGGLDGPTDPYEEMRHGAEAKARGQTCGNATWQAKLWKPEDMVYAGDDWVKVVQHTYMRPEESQVLHAMSSWFGCDHQGQNEVPCGEPQCPYCWDDGSNSLLKHDMHCSRILWGVPAMSSSGLGRLQGGDARTSAEGEPEKPWKVLKHIARIESTLKI